MITIIDNDDNNDFVDNVNDKNDHENIVTYYCNKQ